MDEMPVIQEEVVETSDEPIPENYYEMEEVEFYDDSVLNQLQGLDVRPNTMLCNYATSGEHEYSSISVKNRLLETQEVEMNPRSIFYVIQV